jgi:hypothetical protein
MKKISCGHEVIVAGNFNDDLNDMNSITCRFMKDLGMREIMN